MLTYGDFVTLLQLGFGIGIGLSLFRAPLDLRTRRYQDLIDSELSIRQSLGAGANVQEVTDLLDLKLKLNSAVLQANKPILILIIASLSSAIIDLVLLVYATMQSHITVGKAFPVIALVTSSAIYIAIGIAIEAIVWKTLRPIRKEIKRQIKR